MARPIDLDTVRAAVQRLNELARDHPELCQGEPWANHLDTLEELTTMPPTPPKTRMAGVRERRRAAGYKEVAIWLDPDAQQALDTLAQDREGRSLGEIISEVLKAHTQQGQRPQAPGEGDAWQAFSAAYRSILESEQRGWSTTELIDLLEPVAAAFTGRTGDDSPPTRSK